MAVPKSFHESFAHDAIAPPSDRSTGLVFSVVAILVALAWRHDPRVVVSALSIACVLAGLSLMAPKILRPINFAWFHFGLALNTLMRPLVMFVLFALVVVPAGIVMQQLRDPLRKKSQRDTKSYWIERATQDPPGSMINQF
jgi:hypothetical protein